MSGIESYHRERILIVVIKDGKISEILQDSIIIQEEDAVSGTL